MSTSSSEEVVVRAGYRIHLGFYRFLDADIAYGGIAASLENPQLMVCARKCDKFFIDSPTNEGKEITKRVLEFLGINNVCIEVGGFLAHHVGLGTTTRLILSTLTAVATLYRLDIDITEVAIKLGVGRPSAAGLYTFLYGNLVVDSGFSSKCLGKVRSIECVPKPIAILPIPRDWYVIVVTPLSKEGLSGEEELRILEVVKEHPKQKELYREVSNLLSSIVLNDFKSFSTSLRRIQELTGEYFSDYQGGIFRNDVCSEVIDLLNKLGIVATGQSSWGPTVYGFTNSYTKAIEARNSIRYLLSRKGIQYRVWITSVSSTGHTTTIYLRGR